MRKLKNSELNRLSVEAFKKVKKIPIVVVLDNIRSLNNIGSVFRTSDAFLIEKIYLCGITAKPPHRDIQKTALGATESVYWGYIEKTIECINHLQKEGYHCIAIEQAEQFLKATEVNALAITKLDGTAKGGVLIGISDQFKIPIKYIGVGEKVDQLQLFNRNAFIDALFSGSSFKS